jgi:myxalamid-type polyketide synthase MxaB
VNNDGRVSELLVTQSSEGHRAISREAYRDAGVCPGNVQYIGADGSGTRVGDPLELQTLGAMLSMGFRKNFPCKVGSRETNIHHVEATSGVAGLMKVALCLKHRVLPPSLHLQKHNRQVWWQELPLLVQQKRKAWPESSDRAFAESLVRGRKVLTPGSGVRIGSSAEE